MIWSRPGELQFLFFFILASKSSSLTVIGSIDIGGNAFLIVSFMLFIHVASRLVFFPLPDWPPEGFKVDLFQVVRISSVWNFIWFFVFRSFVAGV